MNIKIRLYEPYDYQKDKDYKEADWLCFKHAVELTNKGIVIEMSLTNMGEYDSGSCTECYK